MSALRAECRRLNRWLAAAEQNDRADHQRATLRARHTPEAIEAAALREMRRYANQYAYRYQVSPVSIWWTARAIQDHYDAMTAERSAR